MKSSSSTSIMWMVLGIHRGTYDRTENHPFSGHKKEMISLILLYRPIQAPYFFNSIRNSFDVDGRKGSKKSCILILVCFRRKTGFKLINFIVIVFQLCRCLTSSVRGTRQLLSSGETSERWKSCGGNSAKAKSRSGS